ncbi:hypothetical protein [Synechococcus sp. M16CYN]|uniref:hypothetical protein n=1 Tax=Synechococcus sp. M16CYN TaxID=3103139 RepID=UPI00334194F4
MDHLAESQARTLQLLSNTAHSLGIPALGTIAASNPFNTRDHIQNRLKLTLVLANWKIVCPCCEWKVDDGYSYY